MWSHKILEHLSSLTFVIRYCAVQRVRRTVTAVQSTVPANVTNASTAMVSTALTLLASVRHPTFSVSVLVFRFAFHVFVILYNGPTYALFGRCSCEKLIYGRPINNKVITDSKYSIHLTYIIGLVSTAFYTTTCVHFVSLAVVSTNVLHHKLKTVPLCI